MVRESVRAGTAGALLMRARPAGPPIPDDEWRFYFDINVLALTGVLTESDVGLPSPFVMSPTPVDMASSSMRAAGFLAFREKQAAPVGGRWISAGVYLLRKAVLDVITSCPCSIEGVDVFPGLAAAGRRLAALPLEGYFIDIGLPDTLAQGAPGAAAGSAAARPCSLVRTRRCRWIISPASVRAALELAARDRRRRHPRPERPWLVCRDRRRLRPARNRLPTMPRTFAAYRLGLQARLASRQVSAWTRSCTAPLPSKGRAILSRDHPSGRDPSGDSLAGVRERTMPIDIARSVMIYRPGRGRCGCPGAIGLLASQQDHVQRRLGGPSRCYCGRRPVSPRRVPEQGTLFEGRLGSRMPAARLAPGRRLAPARLSGNKAANLGVHPESACKPVISWTWQCRCCGARDVELFLDLSVTSPTATA